MYIPGRRRTGSSPSSTVMSLAEYPAFAAVFAIEENPCKTPVLRDVKSVSDRTGGAAPREAQTHRFLHTFAQLFVADRRGQRVGELLLLGCGRDGTPDWLLLLGLGQRPGRETQLWNTEPGGDHAGLLAALDRPPRVRRVVTHVVAPAAPG